MRHSAKRLMVRGFMFSAAMLYAGWAQAQNTTSGTAEEILSRVQVRNAERQAALEHYASERTYRAEYRGTGGEHVGEIVVHAEYLAPDQKRFTVLSESGSKLICEKVLRRLVESEQEAAQKANRMQMTLSADNYDVVLVGEEEIDGAKALVLKVSPKVDSKFTYRGTVWVNAEDYGVMRVAGEPAKNPSWWINRASFDSRYVRRGEFWLPERNVSTSHVRIGGEATLTIEYGSYQALAGRAVGSESAKAEANRPLSEKSVVASVATRFAGAKVDRSGGSQ
jgi:outer membrane lipoprotein-sorting protein